MLDSAVANTTVPWKYWNCEIQKDFIFGFDVPCGNLSDPEPKTFCRKVPSLAKYQRDTIKYPTPADEKTTNWLVDTDSERADRKDYAPTLASWILNRLASVCFLEQLFGCSIWVVFYATFLQLQAQLSTWSRWDFTSFLFFLLREKKSRSCTIRVNEALIPFCCCLILLFKYRKSVLKF